MLRAKLFALQEEERREKIATTRKMQVGTGSRSEKIRTYNYKDSRRARTACTACTAACVACARATGTACHALAPPGVRMAPTHPAPPHLQVHRPSAWLELRAGRRPVGPDRAHSRRVHRHGPAGAARGDADRVGAGLFSVPRARRDRLHTSCDSTDYCGVFTVALPECLLITVALPSEGSHISFTRAHTRRYSR